MQSLFWVGMRSLFDCENAIIGCGVRVRSLFDCDFCDRCLMV
ncbi:hypothetical protein [Pseudanabaena sp. lw0831]|nr:hypothetical protein [Pseudanabaena sp. lw0831]